MFGMKADLLAEEWGVITRFLPEGWRELARTTGALQRARQVRSADVLLRLVFLYAASGLSLQQAAARARIAGLARLTDVALMKRIRSAGPWLRSLAEGVFASSAQRPSLQSVPAGRRLRVVDATHVKVSGSSGTDWRLHYVLGLPSLACDFAELTDAKGGETYKRIPVQPGDIVLGDRGYAHREGVAHVVDHAGDVVVRLNATNFPLTDEGGAPLDVGLPFARSRGMSPAPGGCTSKPGAGDTRHGCARYEEAPRRQRAQGSTFSRLPGRRAKRSVMRRLSWQGTSSC